MTPRNRLVPFRARIAKELPNRFVANLIIPEPTGLLQSILLSTGSGRGHQSIRAALKRLPAILPLAQFRHFAAAPLDRLRSAALRADRRRWLTFITHCLRSGVYKALNST